MLWTMRSLRAAVAGTALAASGLVILALVSCAEPTQIVVQVYSEACNVEHRINQTGIFVGKASDIDSRPPSAVRDGCETSTDIGSLTIYPSGDKDEEVAIKVLSGVDTTPDRCLPPDHPGCIVQRRLVRFIPNTTQHVIVRLSLACLNRSCASGTTCDEGVCKPQDDITSNPGTRPDASVVEGSIPFDAGRADGAALDPCTGCKGVCANGVCAVDCKTTACTTGAEVCAPTLPCVVTCADAGSCTDLRCTTTDSCTIKCGTPKSSCTKVACNANKCDVRCEGAQSCITTGAGISIVAKTKGQLLCSGNNACNVASCSAPTCELRCSPLGGAKDACPKPADRPCVGGCTSWNSPLDTNIVPP
jgi:hypothetical protein